MKAILIDPFAQTVMEVEYDGDWQKISKIIGCQWFSTAGLRNGDTIYVDDEGMFAGETAFFRHNDYPQPLAGKGLILGTDDEGESVEPKLGVSDHASKITFVMPVKVFGKVVWLPAS
jgi:hypothetical protein